MSLNIKIAPKVELLADYEQQNIEIILIQKSWYRKFYKTILDSQEQINRSEKCFNIFNRFFYFFF
jgi:hypothetical protein